MARNQNKIPGGIEAINLNTGALRKATKAEARAYQAGVRIIVDDLPAPNRQATCKEALVASGGKRISLNLPADLVAKIERHQRERGATMTDVILGACKRLR